MRYRYLRTSCFILLTTCIVSLLLAACGAEGSQSQIRLKPKAVDEPFIAWPAFDGGNSRSGINTAEHVLTLDNLGGLRRLWQQALPDTADSSPVELPNVHTSRGNKTILFLTTTKGTLVAVDADTGDILWHQDTQGPKITNSSPAIDPSGKYVYSYGVDGKVHKYTVEAGQEVTGDGWPVIATLMSEDEKGSSALNIGNGYLYMTTSGYLGDGGHYEGHIVAVQLATGRTSVFNVLCANIHRLLENKAGAANYCPAIQAGVWARGGAVIDPVTNNVFLTTGNGPYDADRGGYNYGDSVIELSPDLTTLIDTYTPENYRDLQESDADLGSTAPTLLPKQNSSKTPYLAVQAGKDDKLRLLNRQNLSGRGGPNYVGGEVQTVGLSNSCSIFPHPLAWNDTNHMTWVLVASNCGFSAYKVITDSNGATTLHLAYHNDSTGSSPFIANGILFLQDTGDLRAMNPTTGDVVWSSKNASAGGSVGSLHWESPIVVNGRIYAPDNDGNLSAYGFAA